MTGSNKYQFYIKMVAELLFPCCGRRHRQRQFSHVVEAIQESKARSNEFVQESWMANAGHGVNYAPCAWDFLQGLRESSQKASRSPSSRARARTSTDGPKTTGRQTRYMSVGSHSAAEHRAANAEGAPEIPQSAIFQETAKRARLAQERKKGNPKKQNKKKIMHAERRGAAQSLADEFTGGRRAGKRRQIKVSAEATRLSRALGGELAVREHSADQFTDDCGLIKDICEKLGPGNECCPVGFLCFHARKNWQWGRTMFSGFPGKFMRNLLVCTAVLVFYGLPFALTKAILYARRCSAGASTPDSCTNEAVHGVFLNEMKKWAHIPGSLAAGWGAALQKLGVGVLEAVMSAGAGAEQQPEDSDLFREAMRGSGRGFIHDLPIILAGSLGTVFSIGAFCMITIMIGGRGSLMTGGGGRLDREPYGPKAGACRHAFHLDPIGISFRLHELLDDIIRGLLDEPNSATHRERVLDSEQPDDPRSQHRGKEAWKQRLVHVEEWQLSRLAGGFGVDTQDKDGKRETFHMIPAAEKALATAVKQELLGELKRVDQKQVQVVGSTSSAENSSETAEAKLAGLYSESVTPKDGNAQPWSQEWRDDWAKFVDDFTEEENFRRWLVKEERPQPDALAVPLVKTATDLLRTSNMSRQAFRKSLRAVLLSRGPGDAADARLPVAETLVEAAQRSFAETSVEE